MKKIISILFIIFAHSLYAEVVSPRYDDASTHLGLPSWITFSDGKTIYYPNETTASSVRSVDINLPKTHYVDLMGETYKVLRVDNYGRVSFIPDHEIKDTLWFGIDRSIKNESIIWKAYDGNENDENDINQDHFMTVINQSFKEGISQYVVQYVVYPDGEMQIQLWKNGGFVTEWPDWFSPGFFDGDRWHSCFGIPYTRTMELLGPDRLRPGWIAKSLRDEDVDDIKFEMSQNGKGLHVSVDGTSKDLGGIIAYDNSREHPVVGSFSAVEIQIEGLPANEFVPFKCWYFYEFYGTHDANYPSDKSFSKGTSFFTLTRDDFQYTWNAFMNIPRIGKDKKELPLLTENDIHFIKAPAVKFQRVGAPTDNSLLKKFDFYITSIKYHLDQLPSVQFLPTRTKALLKIRNEVGGRLEIPEREGKYDKQSESTIYELFKGQNVNGTINIFPGNEIDKISVASRNGRLCSDWVYINNEEVAACGVRFKRIAEDKVTFDASVYEITVLTILYKKCSKRELTVVPEIHKTEIFSSSGDDKNSFESASIFGAFGEEIQTQEKIVDDKYMISTSYSNELKQTRYIPMKFVHKSSSGDFEYVDLACKNCIDLANSYYAGQSPIDQPDALGFAYSEIADPNGKNGVVSSTAGIAKRSFAYLGDKNAKTWSIPVSSDEDFIPFENLFDWQIEKMFRKNLNNSLYLNYTLTVSRNTDGKFTQEISDSKGLLKSSWTYNGTNPVITLYDYDEYGHLIGTKLKNDERLVEESTYDAQGRLATSRSNDRGLSEFKYDSLGRLKYTRSAMQKAKGEFSATFYDEYGRSVALGIVTGGDNVFNNPDGNVSVNVRYVSKTIYGLPEISVLQQYGVPQDLTTEILSNMKNIRPNDIGAVISFDQKGAVAKIAMSAYDLIGMNTDKWIILGLKGFPAIRLQYEYDDSKKPVKTSFSTWNGSSWDVKSQRTRSYDYKGRLKWVKENNKDLAKYTYTENGNISKKEYFDNGAPIMEKFISMDVYGRVTDVNYMNDAGKEIYSTKLGFSNDLSNRVTSLDHSWSGVLNRGDVKRKGLYSYDYNDRLATVVGSFAASYEFDEIGRMSKKVEGDDGIEFSYANSSYRASGYSVNGESEAKNVEYFRYDASGNIWYDKHNKVVYKNSELGQPVKITTFTSMPSNITLEDVNKEKDFANVESVVDVAYDEAGNRLWYSVDNRVRNEKWMEVTLPGIGVFRSENTDAANPTYELVRQDLVAGAYRDASGNAHFPVLDAQGSVRGYVTSAGLESAYDYYPYGTVVNVSPNGGDDNRRWQDKEFDNEHHKYYFGSRYFDPFFGMWMSPDPAGQFANPYSYGGDPVNFVDPNGEEALSMGAVIGIAAAVSAVIGGTTAAYQCSKYGAGSCAVAVPQAIMVGAAAGAAGGAAGFAAGGAAAAYGSIDAAVASGLASGTASSATSYIGNGLFTGQMSWGEGIRDVAFGALSGVATASYGMNGYNLLSWAKNGTEILAGSVFAGLGSVIHGGTFLEGMREGALMFTASAFLNTAINKVFDAGRFDGAISKEGNEGFREGDLVVFEVDKSDLGSKAISWLTGEDYTHVAYVDKDLDTGELFFREATGEGQELRTSISSEGYIGRRYKVIGNRKALPYMPFVENVKGGYNLFTRNCTTQATRWTGIRHTNNPGILARYMGAASMPYYNNLSLQHIIWRKFAW